MTELDLSAEVLNLVFSTCIIFRACLDGRVGKLPTPGITPRRLIASAWGRMCMPRGRSEARAASKHS